MTAPVEIALPLGSLLACGGIERSDLAAFVGRESMLHVALAAAGGQHPIYTAIVLEVVFMVRRQHSTRDMTNPQSTRRPVGYWMYLTTIGVVAGWCCRRLKTKP